jgi:hypothetical protein
VRAPDRLGTAERQAYGFRDREFFTNDQDEEADRGEVPEVPGDPPGQRPDLRLGGPREGLQALQEGSWRSRGPGKAVTMAEGGSWVVLGNAVAPSGVEDGVTLRSFPPASSEWLTRELGGGSSVGRGAIRRWSTSRRPVGLSSGTRPIGPTASSAARECLTVATGRHARRPRSALVGRQEGLSRRK